MALVTPEFVFVHVPRTGGTSARAAILERFPDALDSDGHPAAQGDDCNYRLDACGVPIPPQQHLGASKLERRGIRAPRFIGFVRHPVTWYRSMWSWAMRTNFSEKLLTDEFATRHWLASVWSESFPIFLDRVIAMQVPRAWVVFHEKLTRDNGSLCEIGHYEMLHCDLFRLTGCGISTRMRPTNFTVVIPASYRKAIESLEKETIRKFYHAYSVATQPA